MVWSCVCVFVCACFFLGMIGWRLSAVPVLLRVTAKKTQHYEYDSMYQVLYSSIIPYRCDEAILVFNNYKDVG